MRPRVSANWFSYRTPSDLSPKSSVAATQQVESRMPEVSPQSRWAPMFWPPAWKDPKSLDWLAGTPINCLVFAAGLPESDPLRAEALRRNLAIVDWSKPESSGIAAGEASKIAWSGAQPVAAITDAVWPGIRMNSAARRDAADAGPTGAPWIDANGWLAQLAHARAPEKTVWLAGKPPAGRQNVIGENAYQLALASIQGAPVGRASAASLLAAEFI